MGEAINPLKAWLERDGGLLRLRLARPKANIVDAAMIGVLQQALGAHLSAGAACGARRRGSALQLWRQLSTILRPTSRRCSRPCSWCGRDADSLVPILVAIRGQKPSVAA